MTSCSFLYILCACGLFFFFFPRCIGLLLSSDWKIFQSFFVQIFFCPFSKTSLSFILEILTLCIFHTLKLSALLASNQQGLGRKMAADLSATTPGFLLSQNFSVSSLFCSYGSLITLTEVLFILSDFFSIFFTEFGQT